MTGDIEKQWADFDKVGEMTVRQQLANGYYTESKKKMAHDWLANNERQREESLKLEELDISRKAAAASLRAATAVEAQSSEMRETRKEARIAIITAMIVAVVDIIDKIITHLNK